MKKLIYTIICFKCILQITEDSPYQKYIKLFAQLLILCMCCSMIIQAAWKVRTVLDKITIVTLDEDSIKKGSEYYEDKLMELEGEVDMLEYETATGETEILD